MTWYQDKAHDMMKKLYHHKYAQIMINNSSSDFDSVVTVSLSILNMKTQKDYDTIVNELDKITGIVDFGLFIPGKLIISYNQHQTRMEYIVYKISKLGYRYVNRYCKRC